MAPGIDLTAQLDMPRLFKAICDHFPSDHPTEEGLMDDRIPELYEALMAEGVTVSIRQLSVQTGAGLILGSRHAIEIDGQLWSCQGLITREKMDTHLSSKMDPRFAQYTRKWREGHDGPFGLNETVPSHAQILGLVREAKCEAAARALGQGLPEALAGQKKPRL